MHWLVRFCCGDEPQRPRSSLQPLPSTPQPNATPKREQPLPVLQPTPSTMEAALGPKKDRYEGEELNGLPHGNGSILYANGDFYRGEWVNGRKEGRGLQIYQGKKVQYEGEWQDNEPDGEGKMTQANESYYVGEFKAGKKHGNGTYYDVSAKKEITRTYMYGELIDEKQITAQPSREQEYPTLALDKERFDTMDLNSYENHNPSLSHVEVGFLLRYHGLSQLIGLPFLTKSVKEWTVKEVLDFLEAGDLGKHKEVFYKNKIKGKDLATLSDHELRQDLRMKMGDRKRILGYINFLNELQNHKQGNGKLLNKTPKKTKVHNYKLRSNKELNKVLRSVKNHPVFQQRIEEESSESSQEQQKYNTGAKLKNEPNSYSSDERQYGSQALDKNNRSSKESSLEEILVEAKSDQSSQMAPESKHRRPSIVKKISNESQEENHGSSYAGHPKDNKVHHGNYVHQHNHQGQYSYHEAHHHSVQRKKSTSMLQVDLSRQHSPTKSNCSDKSKKEEKHKTPVSHHGNSIDNQNKSSSSTSSEGLPGMERKRTYEKNHAHPSEIRQMYQFLKEHRSLDFLIKEKDIEKLELIGQGGFGKVYRGKYVGQQIAIKDYLKTSQHHHREDFKKQLKIISDLKHPNIVLYMGMCITIQKYVLITEYLQNGSLFDQIHKKKHIFDEEQQMDIAFSIVRGMVYLHNMKKILHRDLKSSNVLMGEDWEVKLCDFGLSGQKRKKRKKTGRVGTYQWMAPEVIRNDEKVDQYADVYSFGVIIWEMLTRKIPYQGLSEQQIVGLVGYDEQHRLQQPEGNEFLLYIMDKCLKRQPNERPTFMEIQSDFEEQFRGNN